MITRDLFPIISVRRKDSASHLGTKKYNDNEFCITCKFNVTLSSEAETLKIRIRLSSIIIGMQCPMTTRDLHVRNMRSICDVIIIHDDKSNEIVCLTCEFCRFVEVAYIEKGEGAAVIVSTEKK